MYLQIKNIEDLMVHHSTNADIGYLASEKHRLIDSCKKCGGSDLSCSCYAKYDISVRKIRANIPPKYRDASLAGLRSKTSAKAQVADYISNLATHRAKGTGLYLWGQTSSAKTFCGSAVLNAALAQKYSAYFVSLASCVDEVLMDNSKVFIRTLESVAFLMIDDIGYSYRPAKSKDSIAYVDSVLDRVMRERQNNLLPIILTCHKNVNELSEISISGIRIASLVSEHMKRVQLTSR